MRISAAVVRRLRGPSGAHAQAHVGPPVVREFLARHAGKRVLQLRVLDELDAVAARNESRSEAVWSREPLHER